MAAFGCKVEKQTSKGSATIDNTTVTEKDDSIRLLKSENEVLKNEIKELRYGQVLFDTIYRPGDTIINTVIIKEDGSVDATGRIKSVTIANSKLVKTIQEKNRLIDSLANEKQKEKTVTKYVTQWKDREVKKSFIPYWIWLLIGGLVLLNFRSQILKYILNPLKIFFGWGK